jgi:hypothetical protein
MIMNNSSFWSSSKIIKCFLLIKSMFSLKKNKLIIQDLKVDISENLYYYKSLTSHFKMTFITIN